MSETDFLLKKPLTELKKSDFMKLRDIFNIKVQYNLKNVDLPIIRNWEESKLHKNVLKNLLLMKSLGQPTPIQMQAIPLSLMFKDIIGIAPTGSGKTFAFLLPLINFLYYMPRIIPEKAQQGPYAIVLGPTRELVIQLFDVFTSISNAMNLRAKIFLGGRDRLEGVNEPAEVVFATIGRFKDLLDNHHATLNQCFYVIIDEADLMIDLNLLDSLNSILENIFHENNKAITENEILKQEIDMRNFEGIYRVTQMYSATMPPSLLSIAQKYLKLPVTISVSLDQQDLSRKRHLFEYMDKQSTGLASSKWSVLLGWLKKLDIQMIIFFNSKIALDEVSKLLQNRTKYSVVSYHSGYEQSEREQIVEMFREGKYDIMLSTDLGGRGLDIEGIKTVVSFDAPKNFETYVHRTGRAARAGKSGTCLTLLTASDAHLFEDFKSMLDKASQPIPPFLKDGKFDKSKQASIIN
jgi:ATP-dependent RNA helicase DDX23/PRP28